MVYYKEEPLLPYMGPRGTYFGKLLEISAK
jgi:hypothetical protein